MILSFYSCFTVKKYTPGQPFVYKTTVSVEGKITPGLKKTLQKGLGQQIDDSLRVRTRNKFLVKKILANPARFDSANVQMTIINMENYLHVNGYYRDSIGYKNVLEIENDQHRVITHFYVFPGQLFRLGSISYNLSQSVNNTPSKDSLQSLANRSLNQSQLKKGEAFSENDISTELNRLSANYRDNGFLRFTTELLQVTWDTLGYEMLQSFTDPLEQSIVLQKRKDDPTADIEIGLAEEPDSVKLVRYSVGTVKIYPDYYSDNPGQQRKLREENKGEYRFYSYGNKFTPKKLLPFLFLVPGDLYRESNYQKTLNKFNSISAWKLVVINQLPRKNEDTVDFEIKMTPAKKMKASVGVDLSYQQGSFISSGGNFLGMGTSLTLINRNLAKGVNEATTLIRYGLEVSPQFDSIQSTQFAVGYIISFPRLLPRFIRVPKAARDYARSLLSANFATESRINYYNIKTLIFSWGCRFAWKNVRINLRFPNIEYNLLNRKEGLDALIKQNASYKYIFNDGLITSAIADATFIFDKNKVASSLKIGTELSGLLTGVFRNVFADNKLYRFIKTEAEYVRVQSIRRSAIAWRIFAGAGFSLPFKTKNGKIDSLNYYMPFFRQYYAGGSGHMRGWTVRKLGPGSTIKSFANDVAPDRYGDMCLELNFEYRYFIARLLGTNIEGALFTDIGNIWFIRKNNDFVNGEFNLSRLWTDIGIGAGTGIRANLGFLKLRLDYSYKAKNPSPDPIDAASQNKWFANWDLFSGQVNLGIGYPF